MLTYRITDCLSDCCTNVSKEAVDEFLRIKAFNPAKAITMYNGIDTNKFKFDLLARREIRDGINIKNDDILLLAAGRLTLAKDYPNLLNAMTLLPEHFKLIIIGDGELRDEINMLIKNCNYLIGCPCWELKKILLPIFLHVIFLFSLLVGKDLD